MSKLKTGLSAEGELRFTDSIWDLGSGKIAEFRYSNPRATGRYGCTVCLNSKTLMDIFNAGPVRGAVPFDDCKAALKAMGHQLP